MDTMDISQWLIHAIDIKGYKSLQDVGIDLDPVTVLVGPNGSGKSSIVEVFRFLQEALLSSPDAAFRNRGGYNAVRHCRGKASSKSEDEYASHISIHVSVRSRAEKMFQGSYLVRFEFDANGRPVELFETGKAAQGIENQERVFAVKNGKWEKSVDGIEPSLATNRLALPLLSGLSDFAPLYQALTSIRSYNIDPAAVSTPHEPGSDRALAWNGANAAGILRLLEKEDRHLLNRILETVTAIIPTIQKIETKSLDRSVSIAFREASGSGRRSAAFDARNMSEGTLRALAVLLAIYTIDPSALIILEEPERAIHPGAAAVLAEAIKEAGLTTQLLVTTHSPDLITYFDIHSLRAVERLKGASHIVPPSSPL